METKFKLLVKVRYFLYTLFAVVLSPFIKPKYINLYKNGNRVGNTTRLIDMFVQDFFTKGECVIYDHHNTRQSRERVFNLVLQRLNREHHITEKDVILGRSRLTIRYRNNH